jgi:hypothetical protein
MGRIAARSRAVIGGVGLIALGLYALLKAAWAAGSRLGIVDGPAWDRAFGQLSAFGHWAALWGTTLLALVGALALLAVLADRATPLGRKPVRGAFRAGAWAGSAVLGSFAIVALGSTLLTEVRVSRGDAAPAPMAAWVYYSVYGGFLVYSLSLAAALVVTRASPPATMAIAGPVGSGRGIGR